MEITVHTEPSCFDLLHDQWLELLAVSDTRTIFQSPAFIQTWWEVYGAGQLYIITFVDKGRLLGLAPLHIITRENKKILTFIGDRDITDAQDFLTHSSYLDSVYSELTKYLSIHKDTFDTIDLFSLPAYSKTLQHLTLDGLNKQIEQQNGFDDKYQTAYKEVYPIIELPQTWDLYLESLDRKQRHEVRRKFKKLTESLEHEFTVVDDVAQDLQAIDTFINLHKASTEYKESFWDKKRERFFKLFLARISRQGWLKLFFLYIENKPVATMLAFDFNNEYQLYNSGYDARVYREYSTGQVLTSYTIKYAIEQGRTSYNFLRGNQEYKFRLGGKPVEVFDLLFS